MDSSGQVDREVQQVVTHIGHRHGSKGLRDLITLAGEELQRTEAALAELAQWEEQQAPPGSGSFAR